MNKLLEQIHKDLNISTEHIANTKLTFCDESPLNDLEVVDIDFEGKPFILNKLAAATWRSMQSSARSATVDLSPFSGFRSYLHQKRLIRRKLDHGLSLDLVLTQTAIPGFSEHHTGLAVDICSEGNYFLSESFENTDAFAWLKDNAARFGFSLSYPRNNDKGIVYEPWHWCFSTASDR